MLLFLFLMLIYLGIVSSKSLKKSTIQSTLSRFMELCHKASYLLGKLVNKSIKSLPNLGLAHMVKLTNRFFLVKKFFQVNKFFA